MIPQHMLEIFMRESNAIEGEYIIHPNDVGMRVGNLNQGDIDGIKYFMALKKMTAASVLRAHKQMFNHRMEDAGSYRLYNVRVGKFIAPDWNDVGKLMKEYFKAYPKLDSWEAHNRFERIHPFGDGNGRLGRLLWLWKAVDEGYDFSIPFLHQYYYQTISHQ